MGALNDGVRDGRGSIVGVIHDMFLIDGGKYHPVFDDDANTTRKNKELEQQQQQQQPGKRELIVAGGNDLQERKKKLMEGTNGIMVLPGGTGTFDEVCVVI